MCVSASFTTCPSLVYREILHYISPALIARCDLQTYASLLRISNNQTFTDEVRSIMKEKLQTAQAFIAFNAPVPMRAVKPCVAFNPIYMNALTFRHLCEFVPFHSTQQDIQRYIIRSFPTILAAYAEAKHASSLPITPQVLPLIPLVYSVTSTATIVTDYYQTPRGLRLFGLWRNLRLTTIADGGVETYDWAFSHSNFWDGFWVITLASGDGKYCILFGKTAPSTHSIIRGQRP